MHTTNRRRFERFSLPAAYTEVKVSPSGDDERWLFGHAYDVSEGGLRLELDEQIEPGSAIRVRISLPRGTAHIDDPQDLLCEIEAEGHIVWQDQDEPGGPVSLAATFTRFCASGDRERLIRRVLDAGFSRAA